MTAANQTVPYGTPVAPYTYTISGFVNGDTAATAVTGTASLSTTPAAPTAVNSYPITAALGSLAASNYSFSFVNGTLNITKAILTVTAANQTVPYGTPVAPYSYTISGFVNGDTQATAVTGTASLSTTPAAPTAVNSYPITAALGSLAASNYSFSFVNGTLNITKAILTVTAANQTVPYGTPVAPYSYTISGFVNGDTQATAVTGTASLSTTPAAPTAVNSYPITAALGSLAASNYSFSFVNGTLNITKAILTVTAANQTVPYGTPVAPYSYTISGFVNGDTQATAVTGTASLSTTPAAPTAVNSYPITAALGLAGGSNYSFSFVNGTLNITKAILTVTAANQTVPYGTPVAPYTYTISGFVNGDTPATAVTGTASLSTTPAAPTAVNSYPITAALGSLAAATTASASSTGP